MSTSRIHLAALLTGLASSEIIFLDKEHAVRETVTVSVMGCCSPEPMLRDEVPAYRQRHNRNSGVAKARRAAEKRKR